MKHDTNYYKNPQKNFTKEMVNDTLKYQYVGCFGRTTTYVLHQVSSYSACLTNLRKDEY